MKKTSSHYHKVVCPQLVSSLRYAGLSLLVLASTLHAANVDSLWNAGNGNWMDAGNWTGGLPGNAAAGDISRAIFDPVSGQPSATTVTVEGESTFDYMSVAQSKNVTLQMNSNASLHNTGTLLVGRSFSGASGSSKLTVYGPAAGTATFFVNSLQIGGKADASGDSIVFSGANLLVSGGTLTLGRQGNGHSLTFQNGVKGEFGSVLVSANNDAAASGIGNNDKLYVTGPGTELTVKATSVNGLNVGPRSLTNQSASNAPSGNAVIINNGGTMRVIGENAATVSQVFIGGAIYRNNNSIQVTGTGSLFEVSGNTAIIIGTANDTSYSNSVTVSQGGAIRTDAVTTISNGPSTLLSRRNSLIIGSGGAFLSGQSIENSGGLVRLADGGILKGETVSGSLREISLNINGAGRFEASGAGLANNVTVNVGNGSGAATMAVGISGRAEAAMLTLRSTVNMKANSVLEISLFGANAIDTIDLAEGSHFSIASQVTLSLSLSGYTLKAGDSFQLFTGQVGNVTGAFDSIAAPTLDSGLSLDWSQFNAAGDWRFTVIPEPSSIALLLGCGVLVLRRRRRA